MKVLEKLLSDVSVLKEKEKLLDEIWLELGPYTDKLSPKLVSKLQRHFKFDDSE